MALRAISDLIGASTSEAQAKTWFSDVRAFLADILGTTGTIATALTQLGVIFGAGTAAKSGAYTVISTDRGKVLSCTGSWTMSLTAAATLGDGFAVAVANTGTGVITIDPSGAETIDGAATIAVAAGTSQIIVCTGTAWLTMGGGVGDGQIEGRHVKSLAAFPALTVSASDALNLYPGLADYTFFAGAPTSSSTTYVTIYGHTMSRANGTVRAKNTHRISNASYTSYLKLLKNGSLVQEWTTTSTTAVERSVDVSVSAGDVLEWQTMVSNASGISTLNNWSYTGSNTYQQKTPYGAV